MEWMNDVKKEIKLMKRVLKSFLPEQTTHTKTTASSPIQSDPGLDKTSKQVDYLEETITLVMKEALGDPHFSYYLRQKHGEPTPLSISFNGDDSFLRSVLLKLSIEFQVPLDDVEEGTELRRFSDCADITEYFWTRKYGNQKAYRSLMSKNFLSNPTINIK